MNRISLFISGILLLTSFHIKAESVGLVLSGGGAKGIAHIGVIQALEDNNIPINYITGTSMGSIVGGLYAAGYSPSEMMELLLSKDFANWSTGVIDNKLVYYFAKPSPTPSLVHFNLNLNDSAKITANLLPNSLINPLPMNFAFMELFSAYTAQCDGDFNKLFVPFRCVASDVYRKRKIVLNSGRLGDAIRASMSFPIVFKPIKIDGVIALDGGIYDNFPVDVMRTDFSPSFMIGVNVAYGEEQSSQNSILNQIEAMVMQPQDSKIHPDEGVTINLNLQKFGLLDFPKANEIYQIGYDKTVEIIDSIKSRVTNRISAETRTLQRDVFKSATPKVEFDSISVSGAKPEQNDYIKYIFTQNDTIINMDLAKAKNLYYRAISSKKIKDLVPQATYNERDKMFDLNMTAEVTDNISLGLGGYITSSTNNTIFLSAAFQTLDFNSFDADISGWVGQSYFAGQLNAKIALMTNNPSYLKFQGVMQRQTFYENDVIFYSDALPSFIINHDNFARLKYGMAIGGKTKLEIGVGYGFLIDYFYQDNVVEFSKTKQDKSQYSLAQVMASIDINTLNDAMYPTSGNALQLTAMAQYGGEKYISQGIYTNEKYNSHGWAQVELMANRYYQFSNKFVLGTQLNVLASTKELYKNYTATIVQAPAFAPTPATKNYFNPAFRANSYAAVGITPIWKIIDNLQLRTDLFCFMPFRKILSGENNVPYYGNWFSNPNFIGEMALVYNLSFASISIYGNYLSYPSKNWNGGVSFGILLQAPKFLR